MVYKIMSSQVLLWATDIATLDDRLGYLEIGDLVMVLTHCTEAKDPNKMSQVLAADGRVGFLPEYVELERVPWHTN